MIAWAFALWGFIPSFLRKFVLIGGVSMFALLGAYMKGRADCAEIHKLRAANAEIARLAKIVKDTAEVAAKDKLRADQAAARIADLETRIGTLDAHARTLNNSCLSGPDADRLRSLWK